MSPKVQKPDRRAERASLDPAAGAQTWFAASPIPAFRVGARPPRRCPGLGAGESAVRSPSGGVPGRATRAGLEHDILIERGARPTDRPDRGVLRGAPLGPGSDTTARAEELRIVVTDDLAGLVTFDPAAPVPAGDAADRVEHEDRVVGRAVDQKSEPLLAFLQVLHGAPALGEVARHLPEADTRPCSSFSAVNTTLAQKRWPSFRSALTAAAMNGDRERCLAAGMDNYVSKPINLEVLSSVLARDHPTADEGAGDPTMRRRWTSSEADYPPTPSAGSAAKSWWLHLTSSTNWAWPYTPLTTAMQLAHKLKGSMSSIGAVRLSSLAQQVEIGDGESQAILDEIDAEYRRARDVVVSLIPQGAGI